MPKKALLAQQNFSEQTAPLLLLLI